MFRKPKRKKAAGLRKRKTFDDDDDEDGREVREALQRAKEEHAGGKSVSRNSAEAEAVAGGGDPKKAVMHTFEDSGRTINQKDLATATVQHHPKAMESISKSRDESNNDNNPSKPKRNKFLAGPIRAPTNIRTTCRFDYQPDICKDYKDTGFCGFGDSCIYLHDRGDTMNGWQLDKIWENSQKARKKRREDELERLLSGADDDGNITGGGGGGGDNDAGDGTGTAAVDDDGIPFACFLCRKAFDDPIVTTCGHYFNQGCLQEHFAKNQEGGGGGGHRNCPVCSRDTHGVMNHPTKLVAKKRKLLGRKATWQDFMDSRGGRGTTKE